MGEKHRVPKKNMVKGKIDQRNPSAGPSCLVFFFFTHFAIWLCTKASSISSFGSTFSGSGWNCSGAGIAGASGSCEPAAWQGSKPKNNQIWFLHIFTGFYRFLVVSSGFWCFFLLVFDQTGSFLGMVAYPMSIGVQGSFSRGFEP